MTKSSQWRIYNHSLLGQFSTTCSNALLKLHAEDNSQLRTINVVRDGRSNSLAVTPTHYKGVPLSGTWTVQMSAANQELVSKI